MEESFHTIRVLGPFASEDNVRGMARRMAEIQTAAWADWLGAYGVNRGMIEATLESDITNPTHLDHREQRLREAGTRTANGEVVQYLGAFSTAGDMVGFAKFYIHRKGHNGAKRRIYRLGEIDVLPQFQGILDENPLNQKLAKKLMYAALAQVRDPKAQLRLDVLDYNGPARILYTHLGLEVTGNGFMTFGDAEGRSLRRISQHSMEGPLVLARDVLHAELSDDWF